MSSLRSWSIIWLWVSGCFGRWVNRFRGECGSFLGYRWDWG
ncbi:MAG: hypothetical protein QXP91_05055 [Candidatus Methanomethylicia archaeon]